MSGKAALIWCPFADEESARAVLGQLLDERLVACGNCLPGVSSLFNWDGARGEGEEVGVLFKTTAALLDPAITRLEALHPYEQAAITGWTVRSGEGTLRWLESETGGTQG